MAVVCSQNSAPRERLAGQAVAHRLRALNEYLALYRATRASGGEAHTTQRIRELRSDVARLRAWGWYLSAKERGASWIPALQRLAAALSVLVSVNLVAQRRHPRGAALQHLSSYSLVERAYAALEDDTQGQLLTLRLAQMQRPALDYQRNLDILDARLADLAALRLNGLPEPGQVTVVCHVLRGVMAVGGALGFSFPSAQPVDS